MRTPNPQRGEGKIGCIVSLLVLAILVAAGFKLVPVLFSNNELKNAADNIAVRAGILPLPTLELQLRDKAKELGIPEALAPGAMVMTKSGDANAGSCTVRLNYTRKIDFYGVYSFDLVTKETKTVGYMDVR